MNEISQSIYLDASVDASHPPSPDPSSSGESFETLIGEREPVNEPVSNGNEADEGRSEFSEFCELFSAQLAPIACELTILTNEEGYATKIFRLDDTGQLKKRSAANFYEGRAQRGSVASLDELHHLIEEL